MRSFILFSLFAFVPTTLAAPKKLLLVGCGPDDHPPLTHEYMAGLGVLKKCLEGVPDLEVHTVKVFGEWKDGPELIGRSDGVVLYVSEGARWLSREPKTLEALRQLASRKGGLSVIHWGMGTKDATPIADFLSLFGACHGGPDRKYGVVETECKLGKHVIARGIPEKFTIKDEFYYQLKVVKSETLQKVLSAAIDGKDQMVSWAWKRPDGGRSFGFSGLHFHVNWGREEYRRLMAQGVLWTLDLPIPEKGLSVKVIEADLKVR